MGILIITFLIVLFRFFKSRKAELIVNAINSQAKHINAKVRIFTIIIFLAMFVSIHFLFYPYEQHFMTFSSEESALSYVSKDISKLERYESDGAIFYVERTKNFDKLFSITRLDNNKFSFVNYNCQVDTFDTNRIPVELKSIYNKNTGTTFYNIDIMKRWPFDEINSDTPADLDDLSMTYSTTIKKTVMLNKECDAYCFYTFGEGEPNHKINIVAGEGNNTQYKMHYLDIPIISERKREF